MRAPLFFSVLVASLAVAPAGLAQDPAPGAALSDEELLHVFITANRGEVVTSQPLLDDLGSEEVRRYAEEMVAAHTRVLEEAEALALAPRDNPVSMTMTTVAAGKAQQLDGMDAPELDMKYLEAQVVLHGHTLDVLDFVLLPNADDAAFRALLERARPDVEMHLRHAEQMAHQMMASSGMIMHSDGMPGHDMDDHDMDDDGMDDEEMDDMEDDTDDDRSSDDRR